ncbi:hypothetical protein WJ63_06780 [Burkholderia pyrrocinia]|nr:hypothetical protein WJ63_06780 [Burkholderia pyrrocinia]
MVYSRSEAVRCSLAVLLRVRGYRTTVATTFAELRAIRLRLNHAAVVAYLGPAMKGEVLFVDLLKRVASPLPIVIFDDVATNEGTSIDALVAELDCTIGMTRRGEVEIGRPQAEQDIAQHF